MTGKDGKAIQEGDHVETRFRGGKHAGEVRRLDRFAGSNANAPLCDLFVACAKVEAIVETQEDLKNVSEDLGTTVRNPPKVRSVTFISTGMYISESTVTNQGRFH